MAQLSSWLLALGVTCSLASAVAQQVADRTDIQGAFASLEARAPGDWRVAWDPATGCAKALYGPGYRVGDGDVRSAADALERSRQLWWRERRLLGLRGRYSVGSMRSTQVRQTWIVTAELAYAGLPVVGGRLDARLHESGVMALFGSRAPWLPVGFELTPQIDANMAAGVAALAGFTPLLSDGRLGEWVSPSAKSPELVIWFDQSSASLATPKLAWRIVARSIASAKWATIYVDARTGAELDQVSMTHAHAGAVRSESVAPRRLSVCPAERTSAETAHAIPAAVTGTVMAFVTDDIAPNGTPHNVPLGGVRVSVIGGGSSRTDSAGAFQIAHAGTAPVQIQVNLQSARHVGVLTSGAGAPVQVVQTVTPGIPAAVQLTSGSSPVSDLSQVTAYSLLDRVAIYVRQPHIFGSAQALASLQSIAVRVMDPLQPCNASFGPNGIAMGGGASSLCAVADMAFSTVVEHEWGHALDDAFGGIGGTELLEGYADVLANYFTGQPLIGSDYHGPGQPLRTALNNLQYPIAGGVHDQGQSWMGACWKVREALSLSLGASVGVRRAEAIVLGAMAANPMTQIDAAREVFVLDDDDGVLNNGTPNCVGLAASFGAHSIPAPIPSCNPPQQSAYGLGCAGSGVVPVVCVEINGGGGALAAQPPITASLAYAVTVSNATSVEDVSLFVASRSAAAANFAVALHADQAGVPAANALATTSLIATPLASWAQSPWSTTLSLVPGQVYWIVHPVAVCTTALLGSGATPAVATLYDPGAGWQALPPGASDAPALRLGCVGGGQVGAVPMHRADGGPALGQSLPLRVAAALPVSVAVFAMGASDAQHQGINLPLDLAAIGAPGCRLLASIDASAASAIDALGEASITVPVPSSPALVDQILYSQAFVLDLAANALGIVSTNALRLEVGLP